MGNDSRHIGARHTRRKQYDRMGLFDTLPPVPLAAINYAAVNFSIAGVAAVLKRYSPAQVVTFIQQEDMRLIDLATKQKGALQELKDLGL